MEEKRSQKLSIIALLLAIVALAIIGFGIYKGLTILWLILAAPFAFVALVLSVVGAIKGRKINKPALLLSIIEVVFLVVYALVTK